MDGMTGQFVTSLIGIALWALIPGFVARKKGRSFCAYYFLCFLITPLITTIIVLCLSKKTDDSDEIQGTDSAKNEEKY